MSWLCHHDVMCTRPYSDTFKFLEYMHDILASYLRFLGMRLYIITYILVNKICKQEQKLEIVK